MPLPFTSAALDGRRPDHGGVAGVLKRNVVFLCIMFVIGVMVALAIGHIVLVRASEMRLRDHAGEILQHAVDVAAMSISIFDLAERSREPICSDANLRELRYLVFHREYLYDIGRIQDGAILCTAEWGRLRAPAVLAKPDYVTPDDYKLWVNVRDIVDTRLTFDMAVYGSVVVFTSPTAFKRYERPEEGLGVLIATHDGGHVYRSFGDAGGLAGRLMADEPALEIGPSLTVKTCVAEPDICVVAAQSDVHILQEPVSVWLSISIIGGVTAIILTMLAIFRRHIHASLPRQVHRAVEDERVGVVYQPLVRIADGKRVGVEVLARMTNEQGEAIPPDIFIGIAEENGFIGALTRIVIGKALTEMRPWLTGADAIYVSINLAASDIIDSDLRDFLDGWVERLGIPPRCVVLEITERSATDRALLIDGVEALRTRGYGVFIDDFGTGHCNLAYLARLPITGIKIDRMFAQAIGEEAVSSSIVEKIGTLAGEMGVTLVMEGVETREQASRIHDLFPEVIGQGWFFGKPASAAALSAAEGGR